MTEVNDQNTAGQTPANTSNDPFRHAELAGVSAPYLAQAPGGHLHPAPVNLNPSVEAVAPADPEPEAAPEPEPAVPAVVREPVAEPAPDGGFARAYLAK